MSYSRAPRPRGSGRKPLCRVWVNHDVTPGVGVIKRLVCTQPPHDATVPHRTNNGWTWRDGELNPKRDRT